MTLPVSTVFKLKRMEILPFLAASALFVGLGILMLNADLSDFEWRRYDGADVKVIVGAATTFFGLIMISALLKIIGPKDAIILDDRGITDNTRLTLQRFIPWDAVKRLRNHKGLLIVELIDPIEYANRGNWLKRLINHLNHSVRGSPVVISDKALTGATSEIKETAERYLEKFRHQ